MFKNIINGLKFVCIANLVPIPFIMPMKYHDVNVIYEEYQSSEKLVLRGIYGRYTSKWVFAKTQMNNNKINLFLALLIDSSLLSCLLNFTICRPSPTIFAKDYRWIHSLKMITDIGEENQMIINNNIVNESDKKIKQQIANAILDRIKSRTWTNIVENADDSSYYDIVGI